MRTLYQMSLSSWKNPFRGPLPVPVQKSTIVIDRGHILCGNDDSLFGTDSGDSVHSNQQERTEYGQNFKLGFAKEWK